MTGSTNAPGELGKETILTVATARQLVDALEILYSAVEIYDPGTPENDTILTTVVERFSLKLNELDVLINVRQQRNFIRKLYGMEGVEYEGEHFICYSEIVGKRAGAHWFTFRLLSDPKSTLAAIGPGYPNNEPLPRIDMKRLFVQWRHVRDHLSRDRAPERLNISAMRVLLENEHCNVIQMVQRETPEGECGDNQDGYTHTPDFCSVNWNGIKYHFTKTQAACVKVMWNSWDAGHREMQQATILTEADSSSSRLSNVFRVKVKGKNRSTPHPAWGAMVIPGAVDGSFRLNAERRKRRT